MARSIQTDTMNILLTGLDVCKVDWIEAQCAFQQLLINSMNLSESHLSSIFATVFSFLRKSLSFIYSKLHIHDL